MDEPLRWLLADPRRFRVNALADFLWLRLLDIPRALAAREYAAVGELVLEVLRALPDRPDQPLSAEGRGHWRRRRMPADRRALPTSLSTWTPWRRPISAASASRLSPRPAALRRTDQQGAGEPRTRCSATGIAPYCSTMF